MPGKIHVWTSRKHHTPRGYQGQEHMTRKCHQFPQKGPKNWPQNQHFAQKFCKMLLGFGPLWPLWPPRLAPLAPSLVRLWPPRLAPLAPGPFGPFGPFGPWLVRLWPPGLLGRLSISGLIILISGLIISISGLKISISGLKKSISSLKGPKGPKRAGLTQFVLGRLFW